MNPILFLSNTILPKHYTFDIDHAFEFLGRNWFKNPPNIFKKEVRKVISKSTP
jgi:hypothetical protein